MTAPQMGHDTLMAPATRAEAIRLFTMLTEALPPTASATALLLATATLFHYSAAQADMDSLAAYEQAVDSLSSDDEDLASDVPDLQDDLFPNSLTH